MMRLIKKQQVDYYECICTGSVTTLEENAPLAGMLLRLKNEGSAGIEEDTVLKNFAKGLISSFERDGYLNGGLLTATGEDIVRMGKAWKSLRGQFKLCIVREGNQQYIVNCQPYYQDDRIGFSLQKNSSLCFFGEFENDNGMKIKELHIDPNFYVGNGKKVDLECVYDYDTGRNSYAVIIGNKKIEFPENTHMFKLVDNSDSLDILQQALAKFDCFAQQSGRVKFVKCGFDAGLEDVLKQIFKDGQFTIRLAADVCIEGIRACVDDSKIARELLLSYLERYAKEYYLGVDEIGTRISEFYYLFAECADIGENSASVFEKLLQRTSRVNKTAYLRLLAYRNLGPQEQQKVYQSSVRDFSGERMSVNGLVEEMLGDRSDIVSVTALTKYAYRNASISRAFCNFANALKRRYNVPLHLITARDFSAEQAIVAKEYFDALTASENIILTEKEKREIEKIHDRYFRIKRSDGSVEWLKMSGELDAIRYQNDFADGKHPRVGINEDSFGRVKEMTVVRVDQDGIPMSVRELMEA